jgi:hypothetical protein
MKESKKSEVENGNLNQGSILDTPSFEEKMLKKGFVKKSKKNKKDESDFILSQGASSWSPSQELILQERDGEYYDLTNLKEDLEKPFKAIEKAKKEMSKNYRDIKSEILKNEGVTAQKFNNLNDNFSRKLNKVQHDNDVEHERFKKEFKRFKISSSLLITAIVVGFAIFLYLFFSKPERPATVVWPEYDHAQQYNPFSDKTPNGSVTVGDPMYTAPINADNGNKPTPFTGMYD